MCLLGKTPSAPSEINIDVVEAKDNLMLAKIFQADQANVRATFTLALSSTGCNRLGPTAEGTCSPLPISIGGNTPVRIPGHKTMMDGAR